MVLHVPEIIRRKREGQELSREEIDFLIAGIAQGYTADYQLAAWAMAVYFKGLTREETTGLTLALQNSGETMTFPGLPGGTVDKHSTGGVGDKTTLIVMAIVSALGVPVVKMSGRGLGYTGGTIDKLEAIPGFRTNLSRAAVLKHAGKIGAVIVGQTGDLAPADKKLYAIRDVTATVDCLPLIAASVMSKKLAAGAGGIVLDVKAGSGAFMQEVDEAVTLAEWMVDIGRQAGRKMLALVTDMDQPLGRMVGNALEVREVIDVLRGTGPEDLIRLSLGLAAAMLYLHGDFASRTIAFQACEQTLADGTAYQQFLNILQAQGGKLNEKDEFYGLPQAPQRREILAARNAWVQRLDAGMIGHAAMILGAGREKLDAAIDPAVGIELCRKVGESVRHGETLAIIHYRDEHRALDEAATLTRGAFVLGDEALPPVPLIHQVIA
jgi:pyrimidine-nucleoside phosphorylase